MSDPVVNSGTGLVTIYMTAADRAEAETIARRLVEDRLVACANVIDGVTSYFWWDGKVRSDNEVVLIAKSRAELVPEIETWVKTLHSYDCPCLVVWPIEGGNPDYLSWIDSETRS